MRCQDLLPLVEKLSDGEATPAERREAEAHLKACADCREHFRFVEALPRAARQSATAEPPEMYWESLPGKVMARIAENETREPVLRSRLSRVFSATGLRWAGALAAALLAAVVGLRVLDTPFSSQPAPEVSLMREPEGAIEAGRADEDSSESGQDRAPGEGPQAAAPATPRDQQLLRAPDQEQPGPQTAEESVADRREASAEASEGALQKAEPARGVAERELRDLGAAAAEPAPEPQPAPEEDTAFERGRRLESEDRFAVANETRSTALRESSEAPSPTVQADAVALRPQSAEDDFRALEQRYPLGATATGSESTASSPSNQSGAEDKAIECDAWRRFLQQHGAVEEETSARYRLALCSIALYDLRPSDVRRRQALEDGESYLALDSQSERADAIQEALDRIEP